MSLAARSRVAVAYRWRHRRWPRLDRPRRFTEWVQWRKLFDRDPALARLTDKLWSKDVATRAGAAVVPTLWHGCALPAEPPAALPLIVKSNHGCNQFIVVRSLGDWQRARALAPAWLAAPYGRWLDEWHYRAARRCLVVEPFIGPAEGLPVDYKIYVFGGRAELVQIHEGRGRDHRWTQRARNGQLLSHPDKVGAAAPPSLPEMFDLADRLGAGHDFLRVDFYDVGREPLFGEFCLYPGSGLDPFDSDRLDLRLGRLWSAEVHLPDRVCTEPRGATAAASWRPDYR